MGLFLYQIEGLQTAAHIFSTFIYALKFFTDGMTKKGLRLPNDILVVENKGGNGQIQRYY